MSFDEFKNLSPFPGFENDPFPPMPPPVVGKKPQMQPMNTYVQPMGGGYTNHPGAMHQQQQQHAQQMGFADVNFSMGYVQQQPNYYAQNNPNAYYQDATGGYMHGGGMAGVNNIQGMNAAMNTNMMVGINTSNSNNMSNNSNNSNNMNNSSNNMNNSGNNNMNNNNISNMNNMNSNNNQNTTPPPQNMMNYSPGGGGGGGGVQMANITSMNTNFVESLFAPPQKRIKYEDANNNSNNNAYYGMMPNTNTTPQNPSPKSPNFCPSPNQPLTNSNSNNNTFPPSSQNNMAMMMMGMTNNNNNSSNNSSNNNPGQVLNNLMNQMNTNNMSGNMANPNQVVLNKECVLHLAKRVNNDLNVLIKFINAIEGEYIPNQNLLVNAKTSITKFTESLHHSLTPSFRDDPPQTDLTNTSLADYTLLDTLGTGTFGRVRLCKYNVTNEYFCVKILSKEKVVRLKQQEHVKSEKSILLSSKHPFIVKLYTTFQDEKNLYFIMEYISGGELFTLIKKTGRLSTSVARIYAAEIILVIEYLHGRNIIHRDLKPENVLIDKLGHLKLTDFGFAKFINNEKTWTMCGTPEYIAPEIILSKGHDKCVDWWSLGVLLFEMLAGHPPFQGENNYSVFQNILSGEVTFPPHFDSAAADLITKLLSLDITQRLGCMKAGPSDVKNHRFFNGVDWDALLKKKCWGPIHPNVGFANDTSNFMNNSEEPDELSSAFTGDQNIFKEF